jgi:hypothetical protein
MMTTKERTMFQGGGAEGWLWRGRARRWRRVRHEGGGEGGGCGGSGRGGRRGGRGMTLPSPPSVLLQISGLSHAVSIRPIQFKVQSWGQHTPAGALCFPPFPSAPLQAGSLLH